MNIRIAKISDLEIITEIYNQSVPSQKSTGHTEPLKIKNQKEWFYKHDPKKYPVYVSEINNKVVGWCSLSPYREGRQAFEHTAEISYYIHFDHHRKGIASKLIEYAINQCNLIGINTLVTFLMEHNTASVNLLVKFGFSLWGKLPGIAIFNNDSYNHIILGKILTDN